MTLTEEEWADYRRRVELREARRREVRRRLGFSDYAGWGRIRRTEFQVNHPEFGGQINPATAHHRSR